MIDPTPVPRSTTRSRPRSTLKLWVFLLLVGCVSLGVGIWWYRTTRPEYYLTQGEHAIRTGDWTTADLYAAKLESAGNRDLAHLLRGQAYHARKRPDLALAEFNQIQDQGAIRLRAAALSGRCLRELGNLLEAAQALRFVVDEEPNNIEAHRDLAVIAYDLGQFGVALDHLQEVTRLDPLDARPYRLMGLIHKDMWQNEQAVNAYQSALSRGLPSITTAEVRLELTEVLVRMARYQEGLEVLDADHAAGTPENTPVRTIRAECLRGLGRRRDAASLLDAGLTQSPSAEMYRLRGQLFLDEAQNADAVQVLLTAEQLSPYDYQTQFLLGQAYAAVGQKDQAIKATARSEQIRRDLDRMTQLSRDAMDRPWDPVVRLQLAEVADRLGRPELAKMWRKAATACGSAPTR